METSIQQCLNVRKWCETQPIIPRSIRDGLILNFLHTNNGDEETACQRLLEFYQVRVGSNELFNKRRLCRPEIKRQLKILEIGISPVQTDEGYCVLASRLIESSPWSFNMEESLRVYAMALDVVVQQKPNNGLLLVYDMAFLRAAHLTRVRLGVLTKLLHFALHNSPMPIMGLHMLNVIPIFDYVMTIFKKVVGSEFVQKIYLHRPNVDMQDFYQNCIPAKCLPADYGGDLPRMERLNSMFIETLDDFTQMFDEEEEKRILIKRK